MDPARPTHEVIRFGPFEANLHSGRLRRQGLKLKLPVQSFQVLAMLLEHPGELVSREELSKKLWPDGTFVDFEHGLNAAVNRLREALADSAEQPTYIETLPRRGYQFIAPVEYAPVTPAQRPRRRRGKAVALAAAAVLLALAAAWFWQGYRAPAPIRSLAVLPLENLSGDPTQEYFADGMTDALITELASMETIRVISRTSVMRYKGARKPLPEIARELKVDAVVEGTVARSGRRVRITAQLIYARTDQHLWAGAYERDMKDVLGLEDEVARAIARQVEGKLRPHPARARRVDPEVYDLYLRGGFFFNKGFASDWRKSQEYFERAIAKDPSYAPAYAGLARFYRRQAAEGPLAHPEAWPKAEAAAQRALELDDNLAEAHAALADIRLVRDWNWEEAAREFGRALALNPSSSDVRSRYAYYLRVMARPEEAVREMKRALELDPLRVDLSNRLGYELWFARRYDEAMEQFRKSLELDPTSYVAHSALAWLYERKAREREAAEEMIKNLTAMGSSALAGQFERVYKASGYRAARRFQYQREIEDELKRPRPDSWKLAYTYALLGEKDKAFEWLEKAYQERALGLLQLRVDPDVDSLRSDPRYQALLRRVNFPE
ncbi:MAG: winged helix-turn-helix domain-containing protein [Candidatus Acidiferrales bacterium]